MTSLCLSAANAKTEACLIALAGLDSELIQLIPDTISLPTTDQEVAQLITLGTTRYQNGFPKEFIITSVKHLGYQPKKVLQDEDLKALVQARKQGQILRALYRLISLNGETPKVFDKFMRRFGKALDRARKGRLRKAPLYARSALVSIEKGALNPSLYPPLHPSVRVLKFNLFGHVDRITELVTATQMPRREYHEIRKKLRDLKIIFALMAELHPTVENQKLAQFLDQVDAKIGDTKDVLKDFEDEFMDGNDDLWITVDETDREVILNFIGQLRQSLVSLPE